MMAVADEYNTSVVLMRRDLPELASFGNFPIRHQGRENVLFCEGHIESPKLDFTVRRIQAMEHWRVCNTSEKSLGLSFVPGRGFGRF